MLITQFCNFEHHQFFPGIMRDPPQFGPNWFSRFDVYWIQIDKQQTNTQTDKLSCLPYQIISNNKGLGVD